MQLLIQNRKTPLRFLLYLEWTLLGIIAGSEILASIFGWVWRLPRIPLLNLCCLVIFGIIGLRLPYKNQISKIIYTGFELILISIAAKIGGILLVPLLYLILIARNCLIFQGLNQAIISTIASFFAVVTQIQRARQINLIQPLAINQQLGLILIVFVLTFAISTVFMQMAVNAIIQEFQSRQKLTVKTDELATANAQLREYALKIEELATLKERNRIACDIHDSIGHSLTVLNLHLEAALKLWQTDSEEATEFLTEAKQLGSDALKEIRQSIAALRVDPLSGLSLPKAIENLVAEFERSSRISINLEMNLPQLVKNELQITIYRIIQEGLTNIYKHAAAKQVKICLQIQAITNHLLLTIEDNGKGFEPNENTSGLGLQSMGDRAMAVGGKFNIEASLNNGCKITVYFPLN